MNYSKDQHSNQESWGTDEERDEERQQRYYEQLLKAQTVITDALTRALRGKNLILPIVWHTEDTLKGLTIALRKLFALNDNDPLPEMVKILDISSMSSGDESLNPHRKLDQANSPNGHKRFVDRHNERAKEWSEIAEECVPLDSGYPLALVEMLYEDGRIKGTARQGFTSRKVETQMVKSIRMKNDEAGNSIYVGGPRAHEHRANTAVRDLVIRQTGMILGYPYEIYQMAEINHEKLEVLAFYHRESYSHGISYALAVKIAVDGAIEVRFPHSNDWFLYPEGAGVLGSLFASEWGNVIFDGSSKKWKIKDKGKSGLCLNGSDLSKFVLTVLQDQKYPTLAIVEAKKWRNYNVWSQLKNPNMLDKRNTLYFGSHQREITRSNPRLENILGIIRLRSGLETPQYLTDAKRDFKHLTGFYEMQSNGMLHYYSIGGLLTTAKEQDKKRTRSATMTDGVGAGVSVRHPQVVEMVPTFVKNGYKDVDQLLGLCRISHYLRTAPHWFAGNVLHPLPMHLAKDLVEDQFCILQMEN